MFRACLSFKRSSSSHSGAIAEWEPGTDGNELLRALCELRSSRDARWISFIGDRLSTPVEVLGLRRLCLEWPFCREEDLGATLCLREACDGLGKGFGKAGKEVSEPNVHVLLAIDFGTDRSGGCQSCHNELCFVL